MIRIPIGNEKSSRWKWLRCSGREPLHGHVFHFQDRVTGQHFTDKNLRQAQRYLPDNIYTALENFRASEWTTRLFGDDVKGRYADLKQASADRCPRLLGTS